MTLALWDRVPEASMVNGQAQMTDYDRAEMSLDFVNDLVQDFQLRNAQFDLIDQVIFLQQRVEIPENFKKTAVEVRSPAADAHRQQHHGSHVRQRAEGDLQVHRVRRPRRRGSGLSGAVL
jgi:hypothetical protein